MTEDKALKRAVRARMAKTGERYTTARLHELDLHRHRDESDPAPADTQSDLGDNLVPLTSATAEAEGAAPASVPTRAAGPGVSDAAVQRATGKTWDEWYALLDAWDGATHNHTEIARHVAESYGIAGWWAQNVTVGYERARGMRARHQRPDGFSMNLSKTFPVPVERLFAALVEDEQRGRWLDRVTLRLRTSQSGRSARFDVSPGETRLIVNLTSRGPEKASIAFQQERLPNAAEVARWKALWQAQLARLANHLSQAASPNKGDSAS